MKVKIFGQKRTGTNLLQWLLQQAGVEMHRGGSWKHGFPQREGDRQICIGKRKSEWMVSNEHYRHPPGEEQWGVEDYAMRELAYIMFCHCNASALYVPYDHLFECPETWWPIISHHCGTQAAFPGFPENYMTRDATVSGKEFTLHGWAMSWHK